MEKDAVGPAYNAFLTLIKIDGAWKVIAEVYHQFEGWPPLGPGPNFGLGLAYNLLMAAFDSGERLSAGMSRGSPTRSLE